MKNLFFILLLIKLLSCVFSQITLDQPGSTLVKPSDTLKIACKVSVSVSSYYWAWVRQAPGKGLEYMGRITSSGGTEHTPAFQNRVTLTRDTAKNEIYLAVSSMRSEDSGTYYCASTVIQGREN
ncbi:hypothetical protein XELAEV_18007084mg [Xenopus laevis]|uniref:Ig-like domain-containing protein n=1 Tax=Xenopus laevis TaxID=8355 RepID=A0A974E0F2_XENLA|nr:hypothetical protein XELAEV_18007084mg [Xenopus laevis]